MRFRCLVLLILLLAVCSGCKKQYVGNRADWKGYHEIQTESDSSYYYQDFQHYEVSMKFKRTSPNHYIVTGNVEGKDSRDKRYRDINFRLLFMKNNIIVDNIKLHAIPRKDGGFTLKKEFDLPEGVYKYNVTYYVKYWW